MPLPIGKPLPTGVVVFSDGTELGFRSLTRAEALHLRTFVGKEDDAELYLIACATDSTGEEARAWYESTASSDVGLLVERIAVFSGLATEESIAAARGIELVRPPDPKASMSVH